MNDNTRTVMGQRKASSGLTEVLSEFPQIELAVVFGSVACDGERPESDVDLAVAARRALGAEQQIALIEAMAGCTGRPIDLVDMCMVGEPLLRKIVRVDPLEFLQRHTSLAAASDYARVLGADQGNPDALQSVSLDDDRRSDAGVATAPVGLVAAAALGTPHRDRAELQTFDQRAPAPLRRVGGHAKQRRLRDVTLPQAYQAGRAAGAWHLHPQRVNAFTDKAPMLRRNLPEVRTRGQGNSVVLLSHLSQTARCGRATAAAARRVGDVTAPGGHARAMHPVRTAWRPLAPVWIETLGGMGSTISCSLD